MSKSKVWFVTGSSRGIGAQIVKAALAAGDRVVATGRKLSQLQEVCNGVPADQIELVELDVTNEAQAEAAAQAAVRRFGRIDVLVNNAAYGHFCNFEEITTTDIDHQFATNVFGLMHVTRAVLPVMRKQRSGHIFNVSSIAGALGFTGASIYCATKYAVEGLSASLDMEVARFGIKVTVVEPGFFRTDFLDAKSIKYDGKVIEDYLAAGTVKDMYAGYHQKQPGDPVKLGAAMVQIANMPEPPKQFLAGSDAIAMVTNALETRLAGIRRFEQLSCSTDGEF